MDSNHDKVIQSHLCYRYTTRQKGGKLGYHIVGKSQMVGRKSRRAADKFFRGLCHAGFEPRWGQVGGAIGLAELAASSESAFPR
jgi:hypothetical protein